MGEAKKVKKTKYTKIIAKDRRVAVMKSILKEMVKKTREHLKSEEFCKKHKDKPKSFTRLRCMGFVGIITLCLNFLRKSLQIEIDKYMELTDPELEKPMTKQAFSKARHKISPEAFKELFEMTGMTVAENNGFGKYGGYRIFAIDGSGSCNKTVKMVAKD